MLLFGVLCACFALLQMKYTTAQPAWDVTSISDCSCPYFGQLNAVVDQLNQSLSFLHTLAPKKYPDPDTGYDVFLVAGQSNAVGEGTGVDVLLDYTNPRVLQYAMQAPYVNQVLLAQDPLQFNSFGANNGCIGFSTTFARYYLSTIQNTHRKVLLVPSAVGGTGFSTSTVAGGGYGKWDVSTGDLFVKAVNAANAAMQLTDPVDPLFTNKFKGILWHQGEADAINSVSANSYQASLTTLVAAFRQQITGAANAPFFAGEMTATWTGVQAGASTIQGVIDNIPSFITNSYVISNFNLGTDSSQGTVHYSAASQRVLGYRYFSKFMSTLALPQPLTGFTYYIQSGTATITWNLSFGASYYAIYQDGVAVQNVTVGFTTTVSPSATMISVVPMSVLGAGTGVTSNVKTLTSAPTTAAPTITPTTMAATVAPTTTLPTPQWKLNFATGAPVNTASGSTCVPSITTDTSQGADPVTFTFPTDATRGVVLKRTCKAPYTGATENSKAGVALTNSVLPTSYTKAVWVKPDVLSSPNNVLSGDGGTGVSHYLFTPSGDGVFVNGQVTNTGSNIVSESSPVSIGVWNHVVSTYDASTSTMKIYFNGALQGTTTSVPTVSSAFQKTLVGAAGEYYIGFCGSIDYPAVYSRALTSSEVTALYTSERKP